MLKPILMAGAMLVAIPALAQTTNGTQSSGTATTTNDHDPTMDDDSATGQGTATVGTQANGGIRSSQTTTGTTGANAQGSTGSNHQGMNHGNMNHGNMNHGTTGQGGTTTGGTMSGRSMSGGTMSGGTSGGTMSGGTSGGSMSGSTMTTGVGGPMVAAGNYPPCSRTVTDSCVQTNERGRARRR